MRGLRRAAAAVAAAWLASTAGAQLAASAPAPAGLALHACRLAGLSQDAQCGTLARPLDPSRPDGTRISLHVVVIPAVARRKQPDPVFFFAGGPGQSAIRLAGTISQLLARVSERRDLVLIDQRGTGHSAPLQCDSPAPDEALARALDRARLVRAMDDCRATLQKLPWGDLRFYTTTIAMADADAVRAALGAERVDLVGISYGTRAALEYLRAYPTHVRRAILDGVAPPDMILAQTFDLDGDAALAALLRDCAADARCNRAYPALADTWKRLLAGLPRAVEVDDPLTGVPLHATLTADAVQSLVRPALYTPAIGALLPHAITEAAAGRFGALFALGTAQSGGAPSDLSDGEHFAVMCSEDAPRLPALAPGATDGPGAAGLYRAVCAHWPRGPVPPAFYTIPASPVPVLLLSGGLDPVTPPVHARHALQALGPKARGVVVANNGHGAMMLPCMRDAAFRYLDAATDDAAQAVDFSCAAQVPRPVAFEALLPARAASAANDPSGFDGSGRRDSPGDAPPPGRPGAPAIEPATKPVAKDAR